MRIVIQKEKCTGHARCAAVAGELYHLDENGYIASEGFDVPPGMENLAKRGSRACPERIIKVVEDDEAV